MIEFWDYTITFVDGTGERVEFVTRERVEDGVLHLSQKETAYGGTVKPRGSWPLCNIRKWEKTRR